MRSPTVSWRSARLRTPRDAGLLLAGAAGATIGSPTAPNTISRNRLFGLYATGFLGGTAVRSSTIDRNSSRRPATGVSVTVV